MAGCGCWIPQKADWYLSAVLDDGGEETRSMGTYCCDEHKEREKAGMRRIAYWNDMVIIGDIKEEPTGNND